MANLNYLLLGFFMTTAVAQPGDLDGYYTVLAPRVLRPNYVYNVAVSTQLISEPTTVIVGVEGTEYNGGVFQTSQSVTVEPYTTHIAKLEIGDIGPGNYNLTARGTTGLIFQNYTALEYVHKSTSVFIQTDKAIYKPGQKVQFRAISLDSNLKPSDTSALDIHIRDGKGNRVKQWTKAQTNKGIFSGELQLSEFPVLGDWTIIITLNGETYNKIFEVAEYVLPKFEVTVDAPAHASFKDSHVVVTVHAKYTYGKAVEGEATVTINPASYAGSSETPVSKIVPINGDATVEFHIGNDLKFVDQYDKSVQVEVSVEEALTGRSQNASTEIMFHTYRYKLELIKTSDNFKPGLQYTAFVKVSNQDGSPVQDQDNPVSVRYGFTYDQNLFVEEKHTLSNNGLIELNLYPPSSPSKEEFGQTVLQVEATYLEITQWLTVNAASSPSNTFIQAIFVTENPKVNEDIEIDINSTESMTYFSYQVISRGNVVIANTVSLQETKTFRLSFQATYAMAPTAHIIVYYVKVDGEVVADALDVQLDGIFENFININVNPSEAEPGSSVELSVESKPNSYVGLLAVDQSVLILKSGNDITKDIVTQELRSYDSSSQDNNSPMDFIGRRYWWPSSATAKLAFENSGSVILTNGLVYEEVYPHWEVMFVRRNQVADFAVPEAVAVAFSGPPDADASDSIRVRRNFPETWIWEMLEAGVDGKQTIQKNVSDTITSWIITGFSVDSVYGLGLSASPTKLTVFRPFFISLNLPYSVIRGEVVAISIIVFNYMTNDVEADVTLENEQLGGFEFAEISNEVNERSKPELKRHKRVAVQANSGSSVSFVIIPKKLGQVGIKVTAVTNNAGDAIVQNLLVKPEGETQYSNKAVLVDLKNSESFSMTINLDIPKIIVEESDRVEISAIGDLMGPSIPNLDQLIRMPYGCGEQNMLNFVPNIVVIEYLKNTNQLTPAIESKALQYLEIGYQQELTYRHSDGSFSAFGESDPSGSTWLTAFVAKSFHQAMPYIAIEESVIQQALQWLSTKQSPNGSFPEVGTVIHQDMQGGAGNGLALTAYTLIAFLENQQLIQSYDETIKKAVDYIVMNLDGVDDIYALALSNYALNLAQHDTKDQVFNIFEGKAQTSGDMKWWSKPVTQNDGNPWYSLPNSVDVEMTAYGLLTYLQRGLVQEALPIMKWLISQRNEQGGFASTQDTVIGLQALAKLAQHLTANNTDITLSFSYPGGSAIPMTVNKDNAMILQKQELPGSVRQVDITASGSGFALVQVSYQYNLNVIGDFPLFTLNVQVDKNSDLNHLHLTICSGFIGSQGVTESNMAVMEVTLPSGFTVDNDALSSLKENPNVKRVETKDGDTVVIVYFEKMTKEEYCINVSGFRTYRVAKQKPVPVTIYDYYDSSRRARVFYEPTPATLCDICDGDDCNTCSRNAS